MCKYSMHSLYIIFVKFLGMCKQVVYSLFNELGYVAKREAISKSSIEYDVRICWH